MHQFTSTCFLLSLSVILTKSTGPSSDCLVAASNNTGGFQVIITCEREIIAHQQNFTGSYLSPQNSNNIWVENVTSSVANASYTRYILLLPLESNIGVLEAQYSSDSEQWTTDFYPLQGIDEPCRTLFIQRIKETLYSVCIYPSGDAPGNALKLYEIRLNRSVLQESVVYLETYVNIDGRQLTNVAYANRGIRISDLHFFVIVEGIVWRITPSEHRQKSSSTRLAFEECVNFTCTNVYYVTPNHLLVHCLCCSADQNCMLYGVNIEIDDEHFTKAEGLPYNCPDSETTVIVNVTSRQVTVQGVQYELEGDGFREGLCSGNSSAVWFAYQDNAGRIFSIDISSSTPTFHMVAEKGCLLGPNCSAISNVSNILVIQKFDETSQQLVAKAINANNSALFEIHSSQPNFFALVNIPPRKSLYPTPSSSSSPSSTVMTPSLTNSIVPSPTPTNATRTPIVVVVVLTVVAVVVVVAIPVLTVVLGVLLYQRHSQNMRINSNTSPPEPNGLIQAQQCAHGPGNGGQDIVTGGHEAIGDKTTIHHTTVAAQAESRYDTEAKQNDAILKSNHMQNWQNNRIH